MKNLLCLSLISLVVTGCSVLPLKTEVKPDHFRLENFKKDTANDQEFVYLMCFHKKPTFWAQPKQYPSGKHSLWVKADIAEPGIVNSHKEAVVNFNVELMAGKSYLLNREVKDGNVSLWIQDTESGEPVSEKITQKLKKPLLVDYKLRKDQCQSGTI